MDEQKKLPKEEILKKSKRRSIWKRIVSVLACVVVFCTTYALILPAITMSKTTFCGLEEHAHSDSCYTTNLICEIETDLDADTSTSTDSAAHVHSTACYTQETKLICTIVETEGHAHTETEAISCGLTEAEAHTHGETCYENVDVLICEEQTGEQTVDTGEVAAEERATENAEENVAEASHTHTETCYEKTLACGKEEHIHEKICYSDKTADVETEADWEATLPNAAEMTGNWREDILAVAISQLGYEESTKNYEVVGDDIKGYTRYGDWYGDTYGDWCAMFVSFCLEYADVNEAAMPQDANCQNWIETLQKEQYDLYHATSTGYQPRPGDLIFFEWGDGDSNADHVGIVVETTVNADGVLTDIKTIEGNSGDMVRYREYEAGDEQILGYGELPENIPVTDEKRVQNVIDLIDALPTYDEIDAKLCEYDELGDMDGYEAYYKKVYDQVLSAYVQYEDLSEELREQVTNADKLMELEWMWSASTMANTYDIPVYQINSFSNSYSTVIYYGKSADEYGEDFTFAWWSAIIVEANDDGELYVSDIITTGGEDKSACKATTKQGFVLLIWHGRVPIDNLTMKVGDLVSVPFDYTQTGAYVEDSYGIVVFSSPIDNNEKLTTVDGADTRDLITVNLYDYSDNINVPYNGNNKYPGFQQDGGQLAATETYHSNFGNNITSDLAAGHDGLTVKDGDNINATVDLGAGLANSPNSGMILSTLGSDGYPALADGTSLKYLFAENTGYTDKVNEKSINGLFQQNEETGAYTFNSRENHAQFNDDDDTFILYEQLISSNFIWYPFGNFLPFNDIVNQTRQASTIDREYFQAIAEKAKNKYNQGLGEEYLSLADSLESWIALMDAKYPDSAGSSWDGADAMNEYFNNSGPGSKENILFDFSKETELMNKIYSIDYDEATDFYFGMEMYMDFMQPKDGLTGKTGKEPMVFYFTGDDDVWIYVDGILFLDLSGIHRHVGGEIDFENGVVKYYSLDVKTGDVSTTPYKTLTFEEILGTTEGLNEKGTFENYSTHTFNFYYMERGAGSGVCRMNFNFPLLRKNSISVAKELSVDDASVLPLLGNPDFKFQILKADSDGSKTEELFIGAGVEYTIYDENNQEIGTGKTDTNGIFTLKAGQRAEFAGIKENTGKYYVRELLDSTIAGQYGDISVAGNSTTVNEGVIIGEDSFTGVETNVKDISDGTTLFNFDNKVTTAKLGSLEIKKILQADSSAETNPIFDFYVTLDGTPLPLGTKYLVGEAEYTTTVEGIVSVPAGSSAVIPKILAGSTFTVAETSTSSKGYTVTYMGSSGVTTDGKMATGIVGVSTTVTVEITNSENGVVLPVTGVKNVSNPDTQERTVYFKLEEVTDETGSTKVENGLELTTHTQVIDNAEFLFNLSYFEKNIETLPVVYYYKITEIAVSDMDNPFKLDESYYIIEVKVSKPENGTMQAEVTNRWKDGVLITDTSEEITFTNVLLCDLTIEKIVSGVETDEEFTFEILLTDKDDDPLEGTFEVSTQDNRMTTITFDSDGKAVVKLSNQESVVIKGIPNGSKWTVTESDADGYIPSYIIGRADSVQGNVANGVVTKDSNTVTFTNTVTYDLPETGGIGTNSYIIGGALLMITSVVLLLYKYFKRGKEEYESS